MALPVVDMQLEEASGLTPALVPSELYSICDFHNEIGK